MERLWIPRCDWWFHFRNDKLEIAMKMNALKSLENFLEKDLSCIPSFSLVQICQLGTQKLFSYSLKFPAVVLFNPESGIFHREKRQICEHLDKVANKENLFFNLPHSIFENMSWERSLRTFFKGLYVNQYASDHKVIVTNWATQTSQDPNLGDQSYPIKAIIFFINKNQDALDASCHHRIEKFLENPLLDTRGVLRHRVLRNIFYHDIGFIGFRKTEALSVTFAGIHVKSAIWKKEYPREPFIYDFLCDVLEFMRSLDFSIHNGLVLGFIVRPEGFFKCESIDSSFGLLFPNIKFTSLLTQEGMISIHLIRILNPQSSSAHMLLKISSLQHPLLP